MSLSYLQTDVIVRKSPARQLVSCPVMVVDQYLALVCFLLSSFMSSLLACLTILASSLKLHIQDVHWQD